MIEADHPSEPQGPSLANPIDILLVEDDPDHTELISLALHKAHQLNDIVICNSGEQALRYLQRQLETTQRGETAQRGEAIQRGETTQRSEATQRGETTQRGEATQRDETAQRGEVEPSGPGPGSRPSLILLDLRMPGMDGLELLKTIKGKPDWATIPVCMLTTSQDPGDIQRCYAAGANGYVSKPTNFASFFDKIQQLSHFWFDINQPPAVSLDPNNARELNP